MKENERQRGAKKFVPFMLGFLGTAVVIAIVVLVFVLGVDCG